MDSNPLSDIATKNILTIRLEGDLIIDVETLMREVARQMRFPSYFGNNWNALQDCMCDLEWLPAQAYDVIWSDASNLLRNAPADFFMFLHVCSTAGRWWNRQGITFRLWIADEAIANGAVNDCIPDHLRDVILTMCSKAAT